MNSIFKVFPHIIFIMLMVMASSTSASTNQNTEANMIADAMKLYTQATPMDTQSSERAQLLRQSESMLLDVLAKNPDSLDAHRKLMGVYLQMRDYPKAIQIMQNAITLSPEDPKLFIALAILYEHSGALEYASAILNEALALDPDLQLAKDYQASIQQKMDMQNIAMESDTSSHKMDKPHSMEKRLSE